MTVLRDTPLGLALNGLILLFVALSIVSWVGLARPGAWPGALPQAEGIHRSGPHDRLTQDVNHAQAFAPNCLGPIIVSTVFAIPRMIITEATLGYLGIGLRPATDPGALFITSWVLLLLDGQVAINAQLVAAADACHLHRVDRAGVQLRR